MPDLVRGLLASEGLNAALVTPAPGSKGQNPTKRIKFSTKTRSLGSVAAGNYGLKLLQSEQLTFSPRNLKQRHLGVTEDVTAYSQPCKTESVLIRLTPEKVPMSHRSKSFQIKHLKQAKSQLQSTTRLATNVAIMAQQKDTPTNRS